MVQVLALATALAGFWVLLSGYWLTLIVALGVASIVLCVFIAWRMDVIDHEGHPIHLTIPGLTYFPWLLKEIVLSNLTVAKDCLSFEGIDGELHRQWGKSH